MSIYHKLFICIIFIYYLCFSDTNFCRHQKDIYNKGVKLFKSKNYLLSAIAFSSAETNECGNRLYLNANFAKILVLFKLNEFDTAMTLLNESIDRYALNSNAIDKFFLLRAYKENAFIKTLSAKNKNRLNDWIKEHKKLQYKLATSPKNPWLAGTFNAIIPGSGHAYLGMWQSAALSFVINSLFLATTIEFSKKELTFPAISAGIVFSITYIGNILSGFNTTMKYNYNYWKGYQEKLVKKHFPEFYLDY